MRMAANLTAVAIENVRLLERESNARASAEESNRLKMNSWPLFLMNCARR